jgi:signal transduction histidine kinase
MGSADRGRRFGLRVRFLIAAGLLVATTVMASVWTLDVLSRLSGAVGDTLRESDAVASMTARVATGLEREDDALLLLLTGEETAREVLAQARRTVDQDFVKLDLANTGAEQEVVDALRRAIDAYRVAADGITQETPGSLVRYHREVNPLLRRAVGYTGQLRDRHFEAMQRVVIRAHAGVVRARGVALGVSLFALIVSVLLALHLARLVIVPLTAMTRSARAIARENFQERLPITARGELGELAVAFNEMAEHLAEFRSSNLGEVLRAKGALEATLEALPDAVILIDQGRRVVTMNRRARALVDPASVADHPLAEQLLVGGVTLATLLDSTPRGANDEPPDLGAALRVEADGTVRRLLARSFPVPELSGGGGGTILVLYDVTDLARLDEVRSELVAVASHELRTPLTTLRMTLLLMNERAPSLPAREQELVATCLAGVHQLGETIDEFLDLTRIEAGQLRLNLEPLDIHAVVDHTAGHWRAQAHERRIELLLAAQHAVVRGDAARLHFVLDNLLSNAMKYTPAGGGIRIDAGLVAGRQVLRVSVTDTGPGIPPELRRRVFEKFFRVEHHRPGSDRATRGVGIGLYLCQEIVRLHGGRIHCDAGDGGAGTCVSFELPTPQVADA